ncbi:TRAP transporter large permease [Spirillospora sp. NPDC029432]|uniref:TRAP transporter large permease n=1 Tax=Spirillospora sp. NPDC029432 TaxID=3154599 RepID=UPI003454A5B2
MTEPATKPAAEPGPVPAAPARGEGGDGIGSWILFGLMMAVLAGSLVMLFMPLKPEAVGIVACVTMLALIFLRVPVAMAMIFPALLGMYALKGMPLVESTFSTLPYSHITDWTMSVVPMFVLMGLLLWRAGLTDSVYAAGRHWLSWLPGGLAVGTNVAGAGLASVSGSSVGTTYALARMGIPEMLKAGYDKRLAIGSVVVAGLPGQLIPPSIMLVIYAGIAEVSIGPQLYAGIGPGILVAVLFSLMIVVFSVRWARAGGTAAAGEPAVTWGDRFRSLVGIWPVPLLVVVIVVGMFAGVFTATEAGAVAALVSLLISFYWARGRRPLRAVANAALGTVASVGAIFLMLVGVGALSRMLTLTGISTGFAEAIQAMNLGRVEFLLLMTVVYLVLGAIMEPLTIMMLTVPILLPTLKALDIDTLWFGVFAVFLGELAVVSPPVGILAFIIHSIAKDPEVNQGQDISLNDVFKSVGWFLPMALIVVLIMIFFPEISTFLPEWIATH